jgi:uncharacterized protein DUF6510
MDESQLRLDGNAAAGMLREVFVEDITAGLGACASCGGIVEIGAQHLYMYPGAPGAVLRCQACQSVLIVIVRTEDRCRLALRGLRWLEVPTQT